MPALWQSSQRPMYIRTVWVDGFRHAVLTHDDPHYLKLLQKRHRPPSSATLVSNTRKKRVRPSKHDEVDVDCFEHFDIVIRNDRVLRPDSSGVSREINIEKLNLDGVEKESESEFMVRATPQTLYEHDTARNRFEAFCLNMKTVQTTKAERSDADNELSQRVLQWLDLAGKVELLKGNNTERLSQPRHSWPEIKRNTTKCKTADVLEDRNRNKENRKQLLKSPKADGGVAPQSENIDRYGYVSSSNTIELYARESRHAKQTLRIENTSDLKLKAKQQDLRTNIAEARKKIANERDAVQKQYQELLTRKLIPEFKNYKKQMHIYIPELPKKSLDLSSQSEVDNTSSQLTGVC